MLNYTTPFGFQGNNSSPQCLAESKWAFIIVLPLPFLAGLVNIFVWLAATVYRTKLLRQNYVYLCVTSTLFSNVMLLTLHLWESFESFLIDESITLAPPSDLMLLLWKICQSAGVSMLFVMSWNLSTLIYILLDNTFFQSASKNRYQGVGNESNKTNKILKAKRRKATILITLSWFIPMIVVTITVMFWNCAQTCNCGIGSVGDVCGVQTCSRLWLPLSNGFMAVNVGFWFVEVLAMISFTYNGMRNYFTFMGITSQREAVARTLSLPGNSHVHTKDGKSLNDLACSTADLTSVVVVDDKHLSSNNVLTKKFFKPALYSNPQLKLSFRLNIVFIVGTLPLIIGFFIDYFVEEFNITAARIVILTFLHLYALLCPILLVRYMSNLRKAVLQLASTLLFCFK